MSEKFEHKLQELLGNIELEPAGEVWQQVKQKIAPEKRRRRFVFWWLLPLGLAGTALIVYMKQSGTDPDTSAQTNTIKHVQSPEPAAKTNISLVPGNQVDIAQEEQKSNTRQGTPAGHYQGRNLQVNRNGKKIINSVKDAQGPVADPGLPVTKTTDQGITTIVQAPGKTLTDGSKPEPVTKPVTRSTPAKDTVSANTAAPVIPVIAKQRAWRFGVVAEAGVATTARKWSSAKILSYNASPASTFPSGSGPLYPVYGKNKARADVSFGIGATARKHVSKNTDLDLSLAYLYQAFSIKTGSYRDSAGTTYLVDQSTAAHRFHSVNLSAGFTWYFAGDRVKRFGLATTLDNMYLVAAKNTLASTGFSNGLYSTFQKSDDVTRYNKWQPHLDLGFVAAFTASDQTMVQLSPYIRYAFRSFEKTPQASRHLTGFGLSLKYFPR